ncbi:LETM1 domain-containing protein 1 isoform X2 [Bacillus rossius redtenbacheri]|uniref:LETM1 domain-containing protein 1 isoform X2 n=1 Tax=Bacillus rossius redtenbacheri TaxID=93214 RepID=UPI002FDE3F4E
MHIRGSAGMSTPKGTDGQRKVREYALSRYLQFLTKYQAHLERQFPSVYHVYRIFMAGMRDFYADVKTYLRIASELNLTGRGLRDLSHAEMRVYHQMPKDMVKVAPVLFLSALPFTNYIILPLLYTFPRQLLCAHFWMLQQRAEFAKHALRRRLYNYRPVFRCLQEHLGALRDSPLHAQWRAVLGQLGSGVHPRTDAVLACRPLFQGDPYSLLHLYSGHVKGLLRMHGMHAGWRRRTRLAQHAYSLHEMDRAIIREGGAPALSPDDLRWACALRGLNPGSERLEELAGWLARWLAVSCHVDDTCWSLLLHCPVLLAYNHPANWVLIH